MTRGGRREVESLVRRTIWVRVGAVVVAVAIAVAVLGMRM